MRSLMSEAAESRGEFRFAFSSRIEGTVPGNVWPQQLDVACRWLAKSPLVWHGQSGAYDHRQGMVRVFPREEFADLQPVSCLAAALSFRMPEVHPGANSNWES